MASKDFLICKKHISKAVKLLLRYKFDCTGYHTISGDMWFSVTYPERKNHLLTPIIERYGNPQNH